MKKILFFITTLIMFISVVNAESEYSEWTDKLDPNLEYEEIIEEKRYRFYKEKEIGEFVSVNKDTSNIYKFEDTSNYIISDYSNWENKCDPKYKYEEKEYALVTPYQKIIDTSFIHLYEFANDVSFNDIKIYANDEEISYTLLPCDYCSKDYSLVKKGEKLLLKLDKNVDTLTLSFYLEASEDTPNVIYRIVGSSDTTASFKSFERVINSNLKNFFLDSTAFKNSTKSEILYTNEEIVANDYITVYDSKVMCRYKEKLTYRYDFEREYYDDNYYVNVIGYNKDEEDFKIYYKYILKEENLEEGKIVIDENDNNLKENNEEINNNATEEKIDIDNDTVIDVLDENIVYEEKVINYIEYEGENIDKNINTNGEDDNIKDDLNSNINNEEENIFEEISIEKNNGKHLVNTMKIKNNNLIKYAIVVVIILTIIYIFYQNKKYVEKRK